MKPSHTTYTNFQFSARFRANLLCLSSLYICCGRRVKVVQTAHHQTAVASLGDQSIYNLQRVHTDTPTSYMDPVRQLPHFQCQKPCRWYVGIGKLRFFDS